MDFKVATTLETFAEESSEKKMEENDWGVAAEGAVSHL